MKPKGITTSVAVQGGWCQDSSYKTPGEM